MENENIEIANRKVKLDIYQHLKIGLSNREKNCQCDTPASEIYYCIPCKLSCCSKCSLLEHKGHILVKKSDFSLIQRNIEKSFENIDDIIEKEDLLNNLEKKREELNNDINKTSNALLKMINDWKNKKLEEIKDIFDEFSKNLKNMNDKEKESKIAMKNFSKKHQFFLNLSDEDKNNKNQDLNNYIFLINYDLLSISYLWSIEMSQNINKIKSILNEYSKRIQLINEKNLKEINNVLINNEDIDPITNQKMDLRFSPLLKFKLEIDKLNTEQLKDIDKRISLLNKGIDTLKTKVMNSLENNNNFKDIEKEINLIEHRKTKGADNLFSQRKVKFDSNGKIEESKEADSSNLKKIIKSKNDININNQILEKYFTHILIDTYDQYFRMPTIELQSSHADLKIYSDKGKEEEESNFAKVIEGTDKIMIFDKKTCKLIKKRINLQKNPHGYIKFPLGCRWVFVNDKLYITGGKDQYREYPNCLIYDITTEKIKRIMDMQNPRSYHTMIFNQLFETLMVIGGEENSTVEIFDPLSNRWQILPELNIPRAIPLFYFDEGRGNMYVLFGIEGNYLNSVYTDSIEVLDLTDIKSGWMKINYDNKARMDFKCHLNIYPLNDYLILIYGAIASRLNKRRACVFHLIKTEMNNIDSKILDELRLEAKNNKVLSSIISSVSKNSFGEKDK